MSNETQPDPEDGDYWYRQWSAACGRELQAKTAALEALTALRSASLMMAVSARTSGSRAMQYETDYAAKVVQKHAAYGPQQWPPPRW